jgi:phytoene dehydrogenase-like protein
VAAYTVSLLTPVVIRDLELARHGLIVVERPVANYWPVDERRSLLMPYGLAGRQRAIAEFSRADAEQLPAYDAAIERAAGLLRQVVLSRPPNAGGGVELIGSAGLGRRLYGLGLADKRLLVDLFTKSAADFLSDWFESEVVKGAFAFDSIVGAYASPLTPGTAYVLLHHCFGEVNGKPGVWGHAVGGMGAIVRP